MQIPNYSNYIILYSEEGGIEVFSKKRNKKLRPFIFPGSNRKNFYLYRDDDHKRKGFSEGLLRYIMLHPNKGKQLPDINLAKLRISILPDGAVRNLSNKGKKFFITFKSLDEAIQNLLLLKDLEKGDAHMIYEWAETVREDCIKRVCRMTSTKIDTVSDLFDPALDKFISKCRQYSVTAIRPLRWVLCQTLLHEVKEYKTTYFSRKYKKLFL